MQEIKAKRTEETWNERSYAPGLNLIVECEGDEYALATQLGHEDYSLFCDGERFYVVTREQLLPGVGVDVFDIRHHLHCSDDPSYPVGMDEEESIWIQEWQVEDRLGEYWEVLPDRAIVKKLLGV